MSQLQSIPQELVEKRRSSDRALVRTCDPKGQTCLSITRSKSKDVLCVVQMTTSVPGGRRTQRDFTVIRGEPLSETIAALGSVGSIEIASDFLVDVSLNKIRYCFRTMAGDGLSLIGDNSELESAAIECISSMGTTERSSKTRGTLTAYDAVRHLALKASPEDFQLFVDMTKRSHKCVFEDCKHGDKFKFDFGENAEDDVWWKLLGIIEHGRSNSRFQEDAFEVKWREILSSFEDPGGKFSQCTELIHNLNRIVCTKESYFRARSKCHKLHSEAKSEVLSQIDSITEAITTGKTNTLHEYLHSFQQRLWSAQNEEDEERKRRLHAWLNDTRVNKYGVQFGLINQLRYELNTYSGVNTQNANKLRLAVLQRDNGICQYCGTKVVAFEIDAVEGQMITHHHSYHIDHIHPVARGGTNDIGNLQVLCESCNLWKGVKVESGMSNDILKGFYKNRHQISHFR